MCSLFHSFILSQLWTVYLEYVSPSGTTKEETLLAPSILLDFWVKVTPGILQLVSHSKVSLDFWKSLIVEVAQILDFIKLYFSLIMGYTYYCIIIKFVFQFLNVYILGLSKYLSIYFHGIIILGFGWDGKSSFSEFNGSPHGM